MRDAPHSPGLIRRATPALGAFVGARLLGLTALVVWGTGPRHDAHRLLSLRWDSLWYARIARNGYGFTVTTVSGDRHSDLAFFPLLPMLERGGHALTGVAVADVGLAVSVVASVLAALGLFALAERVLVVPGERPARGVLTAPFVAVVLWAAWPVGVVEWMAYSESLFTALAVWALYCVVSQRWVSAGLLAVAAGLTRPVGLGVVLAVWVGVGVCLLGRRRRGRGEPGSVAHLAGAALIAPLGLASYVLWVAHRTGHGLAGYLDVQAGWRNGFDGGLTFARFIVDKFSTPVGALAGVGLLVGVVLAVWGVVACFRARLGPPLLVYVVTLTALALGTRGYFGSKPRFFVPIVPLLLPPAAWLAKRAVRQHRVVGSGLGLLVVLSSVFGAFWLNGSGPP